MIVTVVADVLGTPNNGTTIAALNLMQTLSSKGHTVRCICPDKDKKGKKGFYVMPVMTFGPFQRIVDHNEVVLAKADLMEIGRAIKDVDEVHVMMPFTLGRVAAKLAFKLGIPCSAGFHVQAENVTSHFFNFMGSARVNRFVYQNFYNQLYRYVDAVHYPTQFIRDVFEKTVHAKTNGYVISNGVSSDFHRLDVERESPFDKKFTILCTGRYSKEKRQDLLIRAWGASKHRDDIQVVFAGEGPRIRQLEKLAAKNNVKPIFRYFDRAGLVKMINMCDLYVHTSYAEIEAISCLEAFSCGVVPVINNSPLSATRYFALEDTNLFRMNNYKELSKRIDYWFEHPNEKKALAKRYEEYGNHFLFEKCMDQMELMIKETAALKEKKMKQAEENKK